MVLSQSGEAWWYNMQDINSAIRQLERSAHKYEGEGNAIHPHIKQQQPDQRGPAFTDSHQEMSVLLT